MKNATTPISFSIEPALRLSLGKDPRAGASQSMLSRLEIEVQGQGAGLEVLGDALMRSIVRY